MIEKLSALKGKLKVGDLVREKDSFCNELSEDTWTKITKVTSRSVFFNHGEHDWANTELVQVKRNIKAGKPKPVHFLLQYQLDEDPIEEFSTMNEVEERLKELAEDENLQRDSIVLYEIKSKKQVLLETKITIK